MDVFPTLLDLAGHSASIPENLDGRSLVPLLRGEQQQTHDHLVWARKSGGPWVVREGPWKLIKSEGWTHSYYKLDEEGYASEAPDYEYPAGLFLFNLGDDIGETRDVSAQHPEVVERMKGLYQSWQAEMDKSALAMRKHSG